MESRSDLDLASLLPQKAAGLGGVQSLHSQPEGGVPPNPSCTAQSLETGPRELWLSLCLHLREDGAFQCKLNTSSSVTAILRITSQQPKPKRGCKAKINNDQALRDPPLKAKVRQVSCVPSASAPSQPRAVSPGPSSFLSPHLSLSPLLLLLLPPLPLST